MILSRTLLKRILAIALAGTILLLAAILYFDLKSPAQTNYARLGIITPHHKGATALKASAGLPVRLRIPSINVDAALDYVGTTAQGALGVPAGPANAAWYDQGPRPGDNGTAVIDGHFGWKDNTPAVFDDLSKLQKGDSLYVVDDKGATTAFVVSKLREYGQYEEDSDVFIPSDGKPHLNLITCEGVWNETQQSYSGRLVVFADKEEAGTGL